MSILALDWMPTVLILGALLFVKWRSKLKRVGQPLKLIKWIPFKIPFLDELILHRKFNKEGVAVIDELGQDASVRWCDLGITTLYFVRDLEITQKFLKSTIPGHLERPKFIYDLLLPGPLQRGLLGLKFEEWNIHRKAVIPAFCYRSLKIYLQYTNDCTQEMLQHLFSLNEKSGKDQIEQRDIHKSLDYYTLQLMTTIILGPECSAASEEERSIFYENFSLGKKIIMDRVVSPVLLIPPIWFLHPKSRQLQYLLGKLEYFGHLGSVIKRYIDLENENLTKINGKEAQRIQSDDSIEINAKSISNHDLINLKSGENTREVVDTPTEKPIRCILQQLLTAGMSNEEMSNEIATFLTVVWGFETVRLALDMLLFQLALHPEYQKKCQQEVDHVFMSACLNTKTVSEMSLTIDDLSNLKYLEQCILESLRLTPVIPAFGRILRAPLEVSKDVTFKEGDIIMILPWAIQRNAVAFPNPLVYDPDRFLAENVKNRHPYSFLPFAMGARNCVGYKLAVIQLKTIMAWLLRHYDLHTTDKPSDVRIMFDISIRLERPYNVTCKKRMF